jgi:hypothetical protein
LETQLITGICVAQSAGRIFVILVCVDEEDDNDVEEFVFDDDDDDDVVVFIDELPLLFNALGVLISAYIIIPNKINTIITRNIRIGV